MADYLPFYCTLHNRQGVRHKPHPWTILSFILLHGTCVIWKLNSFRSVLNWRKIILLRQERGCLKMLYDSIGVHIYFYRFVFYTTRFFLYFYITFNSFCKCIINVLCNFIVIFFCNFIIIFLFDFIIIFFCNFIIIFLFDFTF